MDSHDVFDFVVCVENDRFSFDSIMKKGMKWSELGKIKISILKDVRRDLSSKLKFRLS